MKCCKCCKKNLNKANYCVKCGYKFTSTDKKQIKKNIFVVILEKLDWLHDFLTGDWLKNNIFFRIFSILIVLGIGLYMVFTMGWHLRLLNNEAYTVKYNEQLDTYYILINNANDLEEKVKEIEAAFYIPNRINSLDLTYYDENANVISQKEYAKNDYYVLNVNTKENNYYVLANHDDQNEKLKIYVYYGE